MTFWAKVDTSAGPEACWPWLRSCKAAGHGQVGYRGQMWLAHRLAWRLTNGPIPKGLEVRHKCDNAKCCNPNHLELGTHAQNMQDMVNRRRSPAGNAHWTRQRPLTTEQVMLVRQIRSARAAGESLVSVATRLNVSATTVRLIGNGTRYAHVS